MPDDPKPGQSTGQTGEPAASGAPEQSQSQPSTQSSWFDSLPAGLKSEKSLEAFKGKDFSALVESHVNAQKMIGSSIRVPAKDAKPEDHAKFKQTLRQHNGVPESAEKYNVNLPEYPEGTFSEDAKNTFLGLAHSLGLNDEQVNGLLKFDADRAKASIGDPQAAMQDCHDTLREGKDGEPGWGGAIDRHLATAKRTVEVMGGPSMMEAITKSGLGNDPAFVRMMARIGKEMVEDGLVAPAENIRTTSDAKGEIAKILADKKDPYYDRSSPQHDERVKHVARLYEEAYQ